MFIFYRETYYLQTYKQDVTQNYVTGNNEYLVFMSVEYLIPHKHVLKILCKCRHFPLRHQRKREWVFL